MPPQWAPRVLLCERRGTDDDRARRLGPDGYGMGGRLAERTMACRLLAGPPGTSSFTHGELAVAYNLRSDGSVDSIDFSPAIIG